MKLIVFPGLLLLLLLLGAAVSALMRVQPTVPVDPDLSLEEWAAVLESQQIKPEQCYGCKPGTNPQPDIAGKVAVTHDGRIIGGEVACVGQFPWQVQVRMDDSYFCGGSIIADKWILTAGHCASGFLKFVIVLGSHYSSMNKDEANRVTIVSRVAMVHDKYNSQQISDDIAVINLFGNISTWNEFIRPVRLPSQGAPSFAGADAVLSGWGRYGSSSVSDSISPVLRYVNLTIIDNDECALSFGWSVRSTNICTSGTGIKGACNGDSGGALVLRVAGEDSPAEQVGIVSFGTSLGCNRQYPSAYTRVASYLQWISNKTNIAV